MKQQRGRYGRYLTNLLTISDFVIISLIYLMVIMINPDVWEGHRRIVALMVNVSWLPAAFMLIRYRSLRAAHIDRIISSTMNGLCLDAIIFLALLALLETDIPNWRIFVELYGFWLGALVIWGILSRYIVKAWRRRGRNFTRVAIVGTGATAARLYEEMMSDSGFGFKVQGFFDYECQPHFPYRSHYRGTLDELLRFTTDNAIDQVYYTMDGDDDHAVRVSLKAADDGVAEFFLVPQITRYLNRAFEINAIGAAPVMTIRSNPLSHMVNRMAKRALDMAFSSAFLVVFPLILVPVAIAIKISSPGPIFFKQKRTGYRGHDFYCLKFRTMKVNKDADSVQATRHDPRKTRVGDFLRRSSIDELPQFINVWKGDMSIVGPRPHMLKHTEEYSKLVDKYMVRHFVRPGITGWAQVNGYRGQTEQLWQMEKRVQFDTWYIENWSFMLDLKIMARTFLNVFRHEEGAF